MQAVLEIDPRALQHNVRVLREHVGGARINAVVKANAYGHGLDLVANAIRNDVDAFGVYEVAEATALRALDITQPIHVLGQIAPNEIEAALLADCTFALWDENAWLNDLVSTARRLQKKAKIQIKINSGLERLGTDRVHAQSILAKIATLPECELIGAYSHLAAAEELDSRFTLDQLETFEQAIPAGSVPQRHIAASAAAMLWPQTRLDMVRIGIALYGIWPSRGTRQRLAASLPLQPALAWRTHVVVVRDVEPEAAIGYGCTFRPATPMRIGILPIGYAEGLPRILSNQGTMLIHGKPCPIIGRICMNMTFVDLTNAPETTVGSVATIIGPDGDAYNDVEDLAHDAQTIGYEIVARLPREIPRRYRTTL